MIHYHDDESLSSMNNNDNDDNDDDDASDTKRQPFQVEFPEAKQLFKVALTWS